jgi:hypothetical protein
MNVQGGEAEDLPGGDHGRGGVQVRDHFPRHVHLSSFLLMNSFEQVAKIFIIFLSLQGK